MHYKVTRVHQIHKATHIKPMIHVFVYSDNFLYMDLLFSVVDFFFAKNVNLTMLI